MVKFIIQFAGVGILFLIGVGVDMVPNNTTWLPSITLWVIAGIWLIITLIYFFRNRRRYRHYNYSLNISGTNVIIENIEENNENASITGTVDGRQAASVLNKKRFPANMTLEEKLEKYAWGLIEGDLKRRNRNDRK